MGPGTFAATALAGFVAATVTVVEVGRGVFSLATGAFEACEALHRLVPPSQETCFGPAPPEVSVPEATASPVLLVVGGVLVGTLIGLSVGACCWRRGAVTSAAVQVADWAPPPESTPAWSPKTSAPAESRAGKKKETVSAVYAELAPASDAEWKPRRRRD